MAAFYVGQRVRLRLSYTGKAGLEGCIDSLYPEMVSFLFDKRHNCGVSWADGSRSGLGAECKTLCHTEQLEPIIPPGLESLEEINALYEPEPMRVSESEAFAIELYVAGICHEATRA